MSTKPSSRIRITNIVARLGGTACLVTHPADLFYLTGTQIEGFYLLLTSRGGVIFTSSMLKEQLGSLVPDARVIAGDKPFDLMMKYCRKNNIKTIGVDPGKISCSFWKKLSVELRVKTSGDLLAPLRQVKDAGEIENMRRSCRIAAKVVERIHALLKPGMTEEYISFKIQELFAKAGVVAAFPTIVASGPNSSQPHHLISSRRLQGDDIVTIDLGCVYKGYCSDLTRTYFLGKMNHLNKKVYSLVEKAKLQATQAIHPGVTASRIDTVARNIIAGGGYGREFIHSTGHGVGIEVHEAPRLSKKDRTLLTPGMVITVEPGIYLSGRFGVRIEDTVLVTEKGNEVLTA